MWSSEIDHPRLRTSNQVPMLYLPGVVRLCLLHSTVLGDSERTRCHLAEKLTCVETGAALETCQYLVLGSTRRIRIQVFTSMPCLNSASFRAHCPCLVKPSLIDQVEPLQWLEPTVAFRSALQVELRLHLCPQQRQLSK